MNRWDILIVCKHFKIYREWWCCTCALTQSGKSQMIFLSVLPVQGALEKAEANQTEELYVELFGEQERLKNLQIRLDGQQKSKRLAEEKQRQVQEELKAMKACHSGTTNKCTKTRANGETRHNSFLSGG